MTRFHTGDRVTVTPAPDDPMEIQCHRHAVVAEVLHGNDGPGYIVGHSNSPNRFGPYPEKALAEGWQHPR